MFESKKTRSIIADLFIPFAGLLLMFLCGLVGGGIKVALIMSGVVLFMISFVIGVVWLNEKIRDWSERGSDV